MTTQDQICRACMQGHEDNKSQEKIEFDSLKSVFAELTLLNVSDDDSLPQYLCSSCAELLKQFKAFKNVCIDSDVRLRSNLVKVKEEIVDPIIVENFLKVEPLYLLENESDSNLPVRRTRSTRTEETTKVKQKKKIKPEPKSCEDDTNNHTTTTENVCNVCDRSFATAKSLKRHYQEIHETSDKTFSCDYCKKEFRNKICFKSHVRLHLNQEEPCVQAEYEHVCLICKKRYKHEKSLHIHCKENHTVYTTGEKLFTCEKCDAKFKTIELIKKHLETHFGPQSSKKTKFKCTFKGCHSTFQIKEYFESHLRCHEQGIPSNFCDICLKPMTLKGLYRHRRDMHNMKSYKCNQCNKVLSNLGTFRIHLKLHKPVSCDFVCDICGMAFKNNRILKEHKASHTDERNFKCDQCSATFKRSAALCGHKGKVHAKQPSPCLICGKEFRSKDHLRRHCQVEHTVYTTLDNYIFACKICDSKFKTQATLRSHERLHTGERPYACTLCPQTFAHSELLKRHRYTHTGERPYRCEVCGKGFVELYKLKVHKKTHSETLIDRRGIPETLTATQFLL